MADELLTGLYSGSNSIWWSTLKSTMGAAGSPLSGAVSDIASLFAESPHPVPDFCLPSPTIDWNDHLLSGRLPNSSSPHAIRPFFQKQVQAMDLGAQFVQSSCPPPFLHDLVMEHNHLMSNSQQSAMPSIYNPSTSVNPLPDLPQFGMLPSEASGYYSPAKGQFHEEHSSSTSSGGSGKRKNTKKTVVETPPKKPRIQMPSPLPTFNVRKEKLQDRVTALQQLVSPFGKTDTASVLHEAIDYIKFLHVQVRSLSAPYLKAGHVTHNQQDPKESKQDLRSRGLCMVPISSTFAIAQEPYADIYWTPNLGGPYIR